MSWTRPPAAVGKTDLVERVKACFEGFEFMLLVVFDLGDFLFDLRCPVAIYGSHHFLGGRRAMVILALHFAPLLRHCLLIWEVCGQGNASSVPQLLLPETHPRPPASKRFLPTYVLELRQLRKCLQSVLSVRKQVFPYTVRLQTKSAEP